MFIIFRTLLMCIKIKMSQKNDRNTHRKYTVHKTTSLTENNLKELYKYEEYYKRIYNITIFTLVTVILMFAATPIIILMKCKHNNRNQTDVFNDPPTTNNVNTTDNTSVL